MQRKAIRATVGATDVDIPIHTFLPNKFLYYDGSGTGAITTLAAAKIVGTPTAGNLASWFNSETIQDSGILLSNIVTNPGTSAVNQVATFRDTTGKAIQATTVTITGAAIANVTTLNGTNVFQLVIGPVGVGNGNVAGFSGTSGFALFDTGLPSNQVVTSNAAGAANQLVTYVGGSRAVQPVSVTIVGGAISGVTSINGSTIGDFVTTAAVSPTANTVATFTGTAKAIQPTTVTIVGAAIANVTTLNGTNVFQLVIGPVGAVNANLAGFSGTSGFAIFDTGIPSNQVVTSNPAGTANQIATYVGGSRAIQNTTITIVGTAIANATTISTRTIADLINITGSFFVDNNITVMSGTTGRVVKDSGLSANSVLWSAVAPVATAVHVYVGSSNYSVTTTPVLVDSSGNLTGVGTINTVDIANHHARHLPAGADSMFSGSWVVGDIPRFNGAGSPFNPRMMIAALTVGGTIVSASYLNVQSPATITFTQSGSYIVYWDVFITTDGSAGTLTINIVWGSATGRAISVIDPIAGAATVNTASGVDATVSIPAGNAAFTIRTKLGLSGVTALSDTVGMSLKWSATPATLFSLGTMMIMEVG